ncbi:MULTISPECIES: VOC family protein [Burkholderia]|uniref:VOC family protein n=1 Tax=Burkholderia TaxID=32008 RepID=UPI0015EEF15A|nr:MULTISPECIES: VOC family protein [Burkholderia]MCA8355028.1 VOC family protein [Burkholderia cepacia]QMI49025.1 VOC family protein [Burkholderia sp. MBR-1]
MQLGYVIVYTNDVLQTVAFYEQAFGLTRRFVHDSNQYAEMETGDTTLAFVCDELAATSVPVQYRKNLAGEMPAGIEVVLVSREIEAAYAHAIANGATPVKTPIEKPWGQKVGYVLDNNGVLVELATPLR